MGTWIRSDTLRAGRRALPAAGLVLAFLAAALLAVLLRRGLRDEGDDLRLARRVPLPAPLVEGTLAVDSAGRAWIGERGVVWALDTLGRPGERFAIPAGLLRVAWAAGGELGVRSVAGGVRLVDARTGAVRVTRRESRPRPLARDPRGRWVYATIPDGGVLGLEAGTLRPRWGWPEAGAAATALAVSPLGDRVYLALDRDETEDRRPRLQVRDALTGRVLSEAEQPRALRALLAGPANDLYAATAGEVLGMRHAPGGVETVWEAELGGMGLDDPVELRVSPAGGRVAVFSRGGLRVLDAATGRVVAGTDEAPLDAAFGLGGRLYLLTARELRVAR